MGGPTVPLEGRVCFLLPWLCLLYLMFTGPIHPPSSPPAPHSYSNPAASCEQGSLGTAGDEQRRRGADSDSQEVPEATLASPRKTAGGRLSTAQVSGPALQILGGQTTGETEVEGL